MIGGYQILDLRSIDLQKSGSASSITDPYVLKQLLMFRDHIDKAYNFAKPLVNQLKPVLVRFRDKKSGEKTEGATFGELSVDSNYYTFKVTARISGALVLRISVAFEEITNDYGNKEWVIDTATIQLKDESKTITGDLELTGDLSVGDDATITGDASVGGALTVTGNVSGAKFIGDVALESIKDANGHARFIEGAVALGTSESVASLTKIYGKWSLSGTHLMIVLFIQNATENDINIGAMSLLGQAELPLWLANKIYPVTGASFLGVRNFDIANPSSVLAIKATKKFYGEKSGGVYINLATAENITLEANDFARLELDLLIDNE